MAKNFDPLVESYLKEPGYEIRLDLLNQMKKEDTYLPIDLSADLLCLNLTLEEKKALLERTSYEQKLDLEFFLSENLTFWHQDLASSAVHIWAKKTDGVLWHRMLLTFLSPYISQRVKYTMLLHAHRIGGRALVSIIPEIEGFEEFSEAFIARSLSLAIDYNVSHKKFFDAAMNIIETSSSVLHPDNKALPSAIAYLASFHCKELLELYSHKKNWLTWDRYLQLVNTALISDLRNIKELDKLVKSPPKSKEPKDSKGREKFEALWPHLWNRNLIDSKLMASAIHYVNSHYSADEIENLKAMFLGCDYGAVLEATKTFNDFNELSFTLSYLQNFITAPIPQEIVATCKRFLDNSDLSFKNAIAELPSTLQFAITNNTKSTKKTNNLMYQIYLEQIELLENLKSIYLSGETGSNGQLRFELSNFTVSLGINRSQNKTRKKYFNTVYRNVSENPGQSNDFWSALLSVLEKPNDDALDELSRLTRKQPFLFQLCFLNTLGAFKNSEKAVLKTLDYIRSESEEVIFAVVSALSEIGTQRALLELIHTLTRPNASLRIKNEIYFLLKNHDLSKVQDELRSAIEDTKRTLANDSNSFDLIENLSSLMLPTAIPVYEVKTSSSDSLQSLMDVNVLDAELAKKIHHYDELSSEVRRALRTAQFFHQQIAASKDSSAIDLSPLIDMQYKALELFFRETYEHYCGQLLSSGVLQRKLDLIGYARPIPSAMDEFESFLSRLPVIDTIPFFSKFKLRKMMRGICQFRPGKRFTLDGLKAFALFFLAFSRSECRYSLANIFPLTLTNEELFSFCKELHVFQDFRNRAAHEGFHPDAKNDIDGIWISTIEIIQTAFKTKEGLKLIDRALKTGKSSPPRRASAS